MNTPETYDTPEYSPEILRATNILANIQDDCFLFLCFWLRRAHFKDQELAWLNKMRRDNQYIKEKVSAVADRWRSHPKIDKLYWELRSFFVDCHTNRVGGPEEWDKKPFPYLTDSERHTDYCIAKKLFKKKFDKLQKFDQPDEYYETLDFLGRHTYHKFKEKGLL